MKSFSARLAKLELKTGKKKDPFAEMTDAELDRILFDGLDIEGLSEDEKDALFAKTYPDL